MDGVECTCHRCENRFRIKKEAASIPHWGYSRDVEFFLNDKSTIDPVAPDAPLESFSVKVVVKVLPMRDLCPVCAGDLLKRTTEATNFMETGTILSCTNLK